MNRRPLFLWILVFRPNFIIAANLCDNCKCSFNEITPFIDCSSLNITELNWQVIYISVTSLELELAELT
jgi:hypothetical protein